MDNPQRPPEMGVLEDVPGSFEEGLETIERWSAATDENYEKLKPAPTRSRKDFEELQQHLALPHHGKARWRGMGVVFSRRSGTHSLSQSMERVPGMGQLAVAALLKEATASSVLSNTSNTVASFVMCNTWSG